MTTFADLVTATLDQLTLGEREISLTLASAVTSTTDTLTFAEDVTGLLAPNAVLDIVDHVGGYETVVVRDVVQATRQARVRRGQRGKAVPHSQGTVCIVNPRFESAVVWRAVLEEISSWGQRIFATRVQTVTSDANGLVSVPVSSELYAVLEARRLDLPTQPVVMLTRIGDRLFSGAPPSTSLSVVVSVPLDLGLAAPSLDVSLTGMPLSATDIPPMGAAWRLMTASEIVRTDTRHQSTSRDPTETPTGSRLGAARFLLQTRNLRIAEEASKLRARWGWRET